MSENLNEFSQALISSMEIVAKSGDQSLSFDKTIECDVIKAVDPATGEYKVRYLNGTISAYDISLEMKYKEGDEVYVQVPQNDMSLKKLIVGKKSLKASDLVDVVLDTERVDKVGIPIEAIYQIDLSQQFGIIGSRQSNRAWNKNLFRNASTLANESDNDKLLQKYAEEKELLLIEAEFKTSWLETNIVKGNFGLEFTFILKDGAGEYVIILDRQAMRGNSLKYMDWTYVTGLLSIEGSKIKSLKSIKLFSEDFIPRSLTESELQAKEVNGDFEIFVKNISINFVQEAQTLGYTVNIKTPDGIYFNAISSNKESLRLQALLKYNGQEFKTEKAKYYWYRKNSSINTLSDKFDEIGGIGWEKIPGDTAELTISLNDIFGTQTISQLFKVVVLYEEYTCKNEVLLYKSTDSSQYELYLSKNTSNIGTLTLRKIDGDKTVDFGENVKYEWTSINNNGLSFTYSTNSDLTTTDTFVSANGLALNNIYLDSIIGHITYYCNVLTSDSNIPIITISKTVKNIQVKTDFEVIFLTDNDGFFSYNAKGDYVAENLNKQIDFEIVWKDAPIAYSYVWIPTTDIETDKDGNSFLSYDNKMFDGPEELVSGEVDPSLENSSTKQPLNFRIKNRFYAEKAENNLIQLNIIVDGITYSFRKNLTFLKEGASGTNGTSLMVKVEPADGSAVALFPTVGSSIRLKCVLYYNGQPMYGSTPVNSLFTVSCSIPRDFWGAIPSGSQTIYLNPFIKDIQTGTDATTSQPIYTPTEQIEFFVDSSDQTCFYVTITAKNNLIYDLSKITASGAHFNSIIQLTFKPKNTNIFNYNLYKLYGVPLVQLQNENNTEIANYFVTGPKEILYDQNGYNPQYSSAGFKIYSDKAINNQKQSVSFGSYRDSVGFVLNDENKTIEPQLYYSKNQRGAVYFLFNNEDYYAQPLIFNLNLFSEGLLNAWDGSSIQIDEENGSVLAAQIGAGIKHDSNKFSGVLMGTYSKSLNVGGIASQTGLLGFNNGEATFGLLDSGDAFFGKSGSGRIILQTSSSTPQAIIQSGSYSPAASTGTQVTYYIKNGGNAYGDYFTSNQWNEIQTANMVITFTKNDKTNRGSNLDLLYFSVGKLSDVDGPYTTGGSYFKIKLKEKILIQSTITSYYREIDANGIETYKKKIMEDTETIIKELLDGGWQSNRTITSIEKGAPTVITKDVYEAGAPAPISTTTTYHYYLYIYDKEKSSSQRIGPTYVRYEIKGDGTWSASQANIDEIYQDEVFTIHTTARKGEGMQINLSSGQIDAADFKLQSSSITINSKDNSGQGLDYAIKVGADTNAFFVRHDGTGKIGGWTINKDSEGVWRLYAGSTSLSSAGEIIGAKIQGGTLSGSTITGTSVSATYLSASNGYIGGWKIEPGGLSNGSAYLYSNGSLAMGSGNFQTTISGSGVNIGSTMSITSSTISMYAGALADGTQLYFFLGYGGIELVHSKSYSVLNSKLKLGWDSSDTGTNIYPYLRLGAGSGSNDTTFWLKKYSDYWWMGNVSGNAGIKITNNKEIEVVGTAKIYATLA